MKHRRLFSAFTLALGPILALLWLLGSASLTQADSPHHVAPDCTGVPAPCHTSLQAAVDAALTNDVILIATGIYTDLHARPVPTGYPYPPTSNVITQLVYISKTITIRGGYSATDWTASRPLTQPTTLDARGIGRAIVIAGNINPLIEGLRLTGGNAAGLGGSTQESSSRGGGGAVYIISATGTLSNNLIFSNTASEGGGLFLRGSATTLNGNTIISNAGGYSGGGVMLYQSTATLSGNIINANTAVDSYGLGSGGGVCTYKGIATLINNTIVANVVESNGGGIFLNNSPNSMLIGNTIMSNTAGSTGRGGGLWMRYDDGTLLSGNSFTANMAGSRGGGIYGDQGYVTLAGNRVASNTAESGGGLYFSGRAVTLTSNFVLSNTAEMGGGAYLEYNDSTLNGNTFSFNAAAVTLDNGEGGGLFLDNSDATLNRNIITFNSADRGGGVSTYRSSPVLTNTVIADNIAEKSGSGLHIRLRSLARLWHTTIARNQGGDGSGVYIDFMGASCGVICTVGMTNTILVSHTIGISVGIESTVTLASTLWYSNATDWKGTGAIITGAFNYWGNPLFAIDGYHLLSGSMAINKGINAGVLNDIDGEVRPQGGGYDLGADELPGPGWHSLYLPLILRN